MLPSVQMPLICHERVGTRFSSRKYARIAVLMVFMGDLSPIVARCSVGIKE
jgi:hypothetical protein